MPVRGTYIGQALSRFFLDFWLSVYSRLHGLFVDLLTATSRSYPRGSYYIPLSVNDLGFHGPSYPLYCLTCWDFFI